jgi:hypothetical protein
MMSETSRSERATVDIARTIKAMKKHEGAGSTTGAGNVFRHSRVVAVAVALAVTLVGCGNGGELGSQTGQGIGSSLAPEVVSETSSPSEPVTDIAPKDTINSVTESTVDNTKERKIEVRPIPSKQPTKAPDDRDGNGNGKLPTGFDLPAEAEIFEPASRLDGDKSFLVLNFETSWETAAEQVKAELVSDGWSCTGCLPFETPQPTKATESWRYIMNMTKGERKLIAIVAETNSGSALVNINFAA